MKDHPLTQFTDLNLDPALLKALEGEGYTAPTPIQAKAIPGVMEGRDLLGIAQTGTGKTAAFALPILHRLHADRKPAPRRGARALILSPTRELATQIADSFRTYGKHLGFTVAVIFGGVAHKPQREALSRGVDILVATPGRLIDHITERNASIETTEILVLDEADQMLDMGFIKPIRQILAKLPARRQSLFFSATMPHEIGALAAEMLRDPLQVAVTPVAKTADRVAQKIIHIEAPKKKALLAELFADPAMSRTLVFTRTKRGADRVAKYLDTAGVGVAAIHGNKSQAQRERALAEFKTGKIRGLIATDIAARGIDIDLVTHVVNYELPNIPESYVHRIGRTARAGAEGIAISFCDGEERAYLRDIERLTRQTIPSEDRRGDANLATEQRSAAVAAEDAADDERARRGGRGERHDRGSRGGRSEGRGRGEGRGHSGQDRNQDRGHHAGGGHRGQGGHARDGERGPRRDRPEHVAANHGERPEPAERPSWSPVAADAARGERPARPERHERSDRFEGRGERPHRGDRAEFRGAREGGRGPGGEHRGARGDRPRFNDDCGPRPERGHDGGRRFEHKPRTEGGDRREGGRPERSEGGSLASVKFLSGSRGPRGPRAEGGHREGHRSDDRPHRHRSDDSRPAREGRTFEGRGHDGRRSDEGRGHEGAGHRSARPHHSRPGDRDGRRDQGRGHGSGGHHGGGRSHGGEAPRPGPRREHGPRRGSQG